MAELRVIRPSDRAPDLSSGPMTREAAISGAQVGAERMWVGHVTLAPGMVSAVHHHGESESTIYIIRGRARFAAGDSLESVADAGPGDFVWVPPHLPHVEINLSDDQPVEMVVVRSTQEAIVVNVDAPEGWTPPR